MPDIAMCKGKDETRECSHRRQCYRHTATPTPTRQSYFALMPLSADGLVCSYYWHDGSPDPIEPAPDSLEATARPAGSDEGE